jgi:hypothetical protein
MAGSRFPGGAGPPGTGRKAGGGKRKEVATLHPRQMNVLAQL